MVTLKIAGRDDVVLELDRALAPDAVEAFLEHARSGDYDGCAFHEVKKDQHVKAGVFDEHLAPKRGPPAPLPPEWGRTKTKYPKMAVAMTGQAEFQILMRNSPSLGNMIDSADRDREGGQGRGRGRAISQEPVKASGEFKFAPVKPVVILKAIVEARSGRPVALDGHARARLRQRPRRGARLGASRPRVSAGARGHERRLMQAVLAKSSSPG